MSQYPRQNTAGGGNAGNKICGTGGADCTSLASPPAPSDGEEDGGTWERKTEGEKETGRGGDSRESEVVPVWREKALCCLSVDRLVKLRRAQGHRPEGFTGLCSFLRGSSVAVCQPLQTLLPLPGAPPPSKYSYMTDYRL